MDALAVTEVIEAVGTGITEPYRCRLSDQQLYAVKGKGALARGLIAEAVCARLGRHLGLPIPPAAICEVDADLVAATEDANFAGAIGAGWCFGSLWREPVTPLQPSLVSRLSQRLLAKIYVFDHWVQNGDRTLTELGGNPNLLIDLETNQLIAIDHNLAFSTSYRPQELQLHAGRKAWLDERRSLVFIEECRQAMASAMREVALTADLPADWIEAEPTMTREISGVLERWQTDHFWTEME